MLFVRVKVVSWNAERWQSILTPFASNDNEFDPENKDIFYITGVLSAAAFRL